MKVKIFNSADKSQLQDEVNAWLKTVPKIKVHRSDTSIKQVSFPYEEKGKRKTRKVPYIATTVWYDES
jgi:hypothetical protein